MQFQKYIDIFETVIGDRSWITRQIDTVHQVHQNGLALECNTIQN